MANETRMSKYKDFRDSFKDEDQVVSKSVHDESVTEDYFFSFLSHNFMNYFFLFLYPYLHYGSSDKSKAYRHDSHGNDRDN